MNIQIIVVKSIRARESEYPSKDYLNNQMILVPLKNYVIKFLIMFHNFEVWLQ